MSYIQIKGIYKIYECPWEKVEVLKGVDLDILSGEAVAILGSSGVGKSTLLHLVGTLDRPSSGQILIENQDIFAMDNNELAVFRNRYLGFIFQFHHLLPDFSALENVMIPALIARQDWYQAVEQAHVILAKVGLSHREKHRVKELSGGEAQRVAVARALVLEPQILLADEPTGNLDEKTGRKIHELILKINYERGITTLIATHNEKMAAMLRRRVELIQGKVYPLS